LYSRGSNFLPLVQQENNLTGTIPPELGLLPVIGGLSLYDNENLKGTIPRRWCECFSKKQEIAVCEFLFILFCFLCTPQMRT
jgi:hypothetical protein